MNFGDQLAECTPQFINREPWPKWWGEVQNAQDRGFTWSECVGAFLDRDPNWDEIRKHARNT